LRDGMVACDGAFDALRANDPYFRELVLN